MQNKVLSIKDLHISFQSEGVTSKALHGINVDIYEGRCTGIVGESGSGKSITFLSAIGLLSHKGQFDQGEIEFIEGGKSRVYNSNKDKCPWLGQGAAIIFQEPLTALNPTMKCGQQVFEALKLEANKEQVIEWFKKVKIEHPTTIWNAYPHEISGGQRQRVMIAMALASEPTLLIADEPTTALDPKVQNEVLTLLKGLCSERGVALVLISHDLGAIEDFADDVYVFYEGKVVEHGKSSNVFKNPSQNYTKALLQSKKSFENRNLLLPKMEDLLEGNYITPERPLKEIGKSILQTTDISRMYTEDIGLRPLSIELHKGEVLAIAGRSGSGKSTFAKLLLQIERWDGGKVTLHGESLLKNAKRYKWIQMVFQDPYSSLHPSKRVLETVVEVIRIHKLADNIKAAKLMAKELLETVGIEENQFNKYPHQFSGGQRQRISIARALAVKPEVIVMDEAVAALDLSIQAKIINLLIELQQKMKLSFIFITHDIHVIEYFADRVALLENGKLKKIGPIKEMLPIIKKEFKSEKHK